MDADKAHATEAGDRRLVSSRQQTRLWCVLVIHPVILDVCVCALAPQEGRLTLNI